MPKPSHPLFAAMYDPIMGASVELLAPPRTFAAGEAWGRVLEVGAGTGQNLAYYDWSRVVSLDLTEPDPHMLRRARARVTALTQTAASKVAMHDASAEALPFKDGEFDTVVATLVLCSVANPHAAISEIWRVLRPGGTLRLVEHVRAEGLAGVIQRLIQPVYGQLSGGCELSRRTEGLVREQGFTLQVVRRMKLGGAILPAFVGIATKPGTET